MPRRGERNVGLSLAGAGVGIMGVAVGVGLTTASGGPAAGVGSSPGARDSS